MINRYSNIIPLETRQTIARRYHNITKIINAAYWNSNSASDHSRYVGSYGRGTAVKTSDIDILIELIHFVETLLFPGKQYRGA